MIKLRQFVLSGGRNTTANTFIGGIASATGTRQLLATRLAINVNRIQNFKVVGANIECTIIGGSYSLFGFDGATDITYFIDNVVTTLASQFWNTTNLRRVEMFGVTSTTGEIARASGCTFWSFPNCPNFANLTFANQLNQRVTVHIPRLTALGSSVGNNGVFATAQFRILTNPILATVNGGSPDGDLVGLPAGSSVTYVTNLTAPNPVTNLSVGTIYNTGAQLNFTPPSSTNAISYYEVWINGGFTEQRITANGQITGGLNQNAINTIQVVAVDIFLNKSVISNMVSVQTTNLSDTDATNYINASLNSGFQTPITDLFLMLKTANLYNKIQAMYPHLGTTSAQHRWNAKNPLDTNGAFRLQFIGAGTYTNLGYTPNGTTGYANTFFIPSANQIATSNGGTVVVGTNTLNGGGGGGIDRYELGTQSSASNNSILFAKQLDSSNKTACQFNQVELASTQTDARGILTGNRLNASQKLFKNGSVLNSGTGSGGLSTNSFFIGAINSFGSPYGYTNRRIQLVLIHEGFTDTEVVILHNIIDIFENALGRKTW